ncbi:MAG TPA: PEP-CTERM sorting domain-containing protein [Methylotenera sp.]|nr:PEP-CTERM sorting domain-containing protein [Methylotenera sp.]HPH06411.1 PEP-CTERM sorting domain-containing protein [Methylotenera sp.]HPN01813.1 PEP-CTERM sorting domain-containing protein [Methylotenera sp.]
MFKKLFAVIALGVSVIIYAGTAQAALNDRGGGLLYDDVLNITWLQDANYAKTSGYDVDGLMYWNDAAAWAGNLSYGGYDDWRLASHSPVNSISWNYNSSNDGSADFGYNISSPNSELAYMYYVNLGLKGQYSPSGIIQPDWGIFGNGTLNGVDLSSYGQNDVGLVKNLQPHTYWSGTAYEPDTILNWYFAPSIGYQGVTINVNNLYAWAVRDGDVAAVPEPETYAMLLAGLGLVGFSVKRRKQYANMIATS